MVLSLALDHRIARSREHVLTVFRAASLGRPVGRDIYGRDDIMVLVTGIHHTGFDVPRRSHSGLHR